MAKKNRKLRDIGSQDNKTRFNMKVVTSDKCESCRQCERGLRYLEKMSLPGAVGYGVPCILTKGKAYK
jgi:hypothetical protein